MKREDAIKAMSIINEIDTLEKSRLAVKRAITVFEKSEKLAMRIDLCTKNSGMEDNFFFEGLSTDGKRKVLYLIEKDYHDSITQLEESLQKL